MTTKYNFFKHGLTLMIGLIFTAFLAFFGAKNVKAAANDTYRVKINGTADRGFAKDVLKLINEERRRLGINELIQDVEMSDISLQRAAEVSVYDSHTRPDGSYYNTINRKKQDGENILSFGTTNASPSAAFEGWKKSQGHYALMTYASARHAGIGAFVDEDGFYRVVLTISCINPASNSGVSFVVDTRANKEAVVREIDILEMDLPFYLNCNVSNCFDTSNKLTIAPGEEYQLRANREMTSPVDPSSFYWNSSNQSVATVDQKGIVNTIKEGTTTITATTKQGNGSFSLTLTCKRVDLNNPYTITGRYSSKKTRVSVTGTYYYTGNPITPNVIVKMVDGTVLQKDIDYSVSCTSNTEVGIATVTITGKNKYTGSISSLFSILPRENGGSNSGSTSGKTSGVRVTTPSFTAGSNSAPVKKYTQGLNKVNGTWQYVDAYGNRIKFTGVVKNPANNKWHFVRDGVFDSKYTGLAKSVKNGKLYYVQKGTLKWSYTGLVKYGKKWYAVKKGAKSNFTGVVQNKSNKKWYFCKNGVYTKNYTGLAKSITNGKLYYVKKGVLNWKYSGTVKYNGKRYRVKKGVARRA